ncbi:MAG: hypothetical protein A2381_00850 [Bdellovibrionales bacterium RIFOXYB1_FULL_37_110]|nr:MAG: hypothetical protein A2417_01705 [Bdellovibrionales bacterium RIFOXYC1_FULL_37_79]OFZ58768.1 MAG: hypothetical protein A2381_00850 [Bdellovibrionales bacterium RIFOXYB1_FULL_37_110]OFZ64767.1 MAG: hypothetical protein A2577_06850 [Bdellovibrionales bacterium RIFOXYD1_FULL_36_51]
MNYKIVTTQNLLIILFSKSLALCINLLAAKLLPKEQFGFFVYYILILSFAPLLQLSSLKGLILLYPKEKMNTANSIHFFQNYNTFSIMMHTLTSLAIFLFDLNVSLPIMFCIYFSLLFEKYIENRYVFFSTHHQFYKLNVFKAIQEIGIPTLRLIGIYIFSSLEILFIVPVVINSLITIYFLFSTKFRDFKINANLYLHNKTILLFSIPLLIMWLGEALFRGLDKMFINWFYSKLDLATYGFASSLSIVAWLFIQGYAAPYMQQIFDTISQNNIHKSKFEITSLLKKLLLGCLIISISGPIFYHLLTLNFLPNYKSQELVFCILLINGTLLGIIGILSQLLASLNQSLTVVKIFIGSVLLNILLNAGIPILNLSYKYFSLTTLICLSIIFVIFVRSLQKLSCRLSTMP